MTIDAGQSVTLREAAPNGAGSTRDDGGQKDWVSRGEWILAWVIFTGILCLRIVYNFKARFNSDEPQHLHVVWAWASGLLPYKDVFDNHMPLFHLAMAPILRLFGERADIVVCMRFVMLPLYLSSVWAVFRIGTIVFSRRAGLWGALLVAAWPGTEATGLLFFSEQYRTGRFFFKMCEFRTDVLWTVLWLLALWVAVAKPMTRARAFFVGLLIGAALGVSMKTCVMLITLAACLGGLALLARQAGACKGSGLTWSHLPAALAGFCIVPAAIAGYFSFRHALPEMYYCVLTHNVQGGSSLWGRVRHHYLLILGGGAAAWFLARRVLRTAPDPGSGLRRAFIVLVACFYYIVLYGFWPMVPPQDLLPSDAVAGLCLGVWLVYLGGWLVRKTSQPRWTLWPVLAALGCEFVLMLTQVDIREDSTSRQARLIGDVLKLTAPGQPIMDGKGETVYRPRASYLVLETISNRGLERGTLADILVEDMIRGKVTVVHDPDRMPPKDMSWVKANYVSVGDVYVPGKLLPPPSNGIASFDLVIPETYAIVSDHGDFAGELDGVSYSSPRYLGAGHHEFRRAKPNARQQLVVMWARAAELGYQPRFFELASKEPASRPH